MERAEFILFKQQSSAPLHEYEEMDLLAGSMDCIRANVPLLFHCVTP